MQSDRNVFSLFNKKYNLNRHTFLRILKGMKKLKQKKDTW